MHSWWLYKAKTGMAILSYVYHIHNLGEKIKTIEVDHKISDHPILIFKKRTCIPLNEDIDNKIILDNKIVEENNLKICNIINIEASNFINPYKKN